MELIAAGRPLPAGAFAARGSGDGAAVAAWPADPGAGFAVPFDLVASAFVLLACWDERTTARARQVRPAAVLGERLRREPGAAHRRAGRGPLRRAPARRPGAAPRRARPRAAAGRPGSVWGARGRFAIALTHDLDNLWRWTRRGFAASGYRTPRAARHLDAGRRRAASSATAPTGWSATCRAAATPSGPSRSSCDGEDAARRLLDLLRDRPPHAQAGRQPAGDLPARGSPRPCDLVTAAGREVGLHGNDADRLALEPTCTGDRDDLAAARRPLRHRRPLPLPARALPRDAAAAGAGRVHLRHHAWRSPSTRASAAAARSRSGRTPWRRSGPSTSSSCRSP